MGLVGAFIFDIPIKQTAFCCWCFTGNVSDEPQSTYFTISWLLNQNIFSSCYHLLYQLSLWHRWFKFLTEGHTGHWWQKAAWSSPSPGVLQKSAWTGTYLHFKAFSKVLFPLENKWNSFQNLPNETGLSWLLPRIFYFWDIIFYSFFFSGNLSFTHAFSSLSPLPHIFSVSAFFQCISGRFLIWKTYFLFC